MLKCWVEPRMNANSCTGTSNQNLVFFVVSFASVRVHSRPFAVKFPSPSQYDPFALQSGVFEIQEQSEFQTSDL